MAASAKYSAPLLGIVGAVAGTSVAVAGTSVACTLYVTTAKFESELEIKLLNAKLLPEIERLKSENKSLNEKLVLQEKALKVEIGKNVAVARQQTAENFSKLGFVKDNESPQNLKLIFSLGLKVCVRF